MPVNSVLSPYAVFVDAAGLPLENGYIYVGQPGFEARSNPKESYFDTALTIPAGTSSGAALRTKAGFPVNTSNAPAMFYVDGDYSISVTDRNGVLLYSALNQTLAINVGAVGPALGTDGNLAAVGIGFTNEPDTGFVRSATATMQTVIDGVLVVQQTPAGTVFNQPISGSGFTSAIAGLQPLNAKLTAISSNSGVTTAEVAAATLVTASETIRSNNNDTTLPTSAAVAQEAIGLFYVLNSTTAGANVNTVQDFFPQDVTPEGSTQYVYELVVAMVKTAGGTAHAIETSFAGTATLNYILRNFYASAITGGATVAAPLTTNGYKTSAAAENMTGSFSSATASFWMRDTGIVSVNASGTLIPQYRLTAAPGGAYSVVAGSYFRLRKLGASGADIAIGPWA